MPESSIRIPCIQIRNIFFLMLLFPFFNLYALHVIRGPYLTRATNNGISIHWRTDSVCNARVNYGLQPGTFTGGVVNSIPGTDHVIHLQGLQPGTRYYYSIGTAFQTLAGDSSFYFKTLPVAGTQYNQPIRIWAVGDIAKANQNEIRVRNGMLSYFQGGRPDVYLMLGDNSYPSGLDSNFQQGFFNYFQDEVCRNTVLWPVTGNHEYDNNYTLRQTKNIPYFSIFTLPAQGESGGWPSGTEMYYSFDVGNIHFVQLDSYGLEQVGGSDYGFTDTLVSPQIHWLKQDLEKNQLPWVIVSFHHPPYTMGTHHSDWEPELAAIHEKLNPILEHYNVDLVLNGHSHTYERTPMIHHHYGVEASFDSLEHVVQGGGGLFDSSGHCLYFKGSWPPRATDSGTVYAVIGCGSDDHFPPQSNWPHNAMYYSNATDNGSMVITVEGNELKAVFLTTDSTQLIKDSFRIIKNVNRNHWVSFQPGLAVNLKAGWEQPEPYAWSNGDSTRTIAYYPQQDTTLWVCSQQGCFCDTFILQKKAPSQVSEPELDNDVQLYPNPASSQVMLSGLPGDGEYVLSLFDSRGVCIQKQVLACHNRVLKYPLPVLPEGVYYVSWITPGGKKSGQSFRIHSR